MFKFLPIVAKIMVIVLARNKRNENKIMVVDNMVGGQKCKKCIKCGYKNAAIKDILAIQLFEFPIL